MPSFTNSSCLSPLCVDLDHTLIMTDVLHKTVPLFIRTYPWKMLHMVIWFLRGRAIFKERLSQHVQFPAELLPYNQRVLNFLKEEKSKGRQIILATGSDQSIADSVSTYLKLFTAAYGSNGQVNLTGKDKAALLVQLFGEKEFTYVGDAAVDLKVWRHAKEAIIVTSSQSLIKAAQKVCGKVKQFN